MADQYKGRLVRKEGRIGELRIGDYYRDHRGQKLYRVTKITINKENPEFLLLGRAEIHKGRSKEVEAEKYHIHEPINKFSMPEHPGDDQLSVASLDVTHSPSHDSEKDLEFEHDGLQNCLSLSDHLYFQLGRAEIHKGRSKEVEAEKYHIHEPINKFSMPEHTGDDQLSVASLDVTHSPSHDSKKDLEFEYDGLQNYSSLSDHPHFQTPAPAAGGDAPAPAPMPILEMIMDSGFGKSEALEALEACSNNPDRAMEYLLTTSAEPATPATAATAAPPAEEIAEQLVAMGFSRDQGIPAQSEAAPPPAKAPAPAATPAQPAAGGQPTAQNPRETGGSVQTLFGPDDPLDFLRSQPQFQRMRQIVQDHPDRLSAFLQQIYHSNPHLFQVIQANQERFVQILSESGSEGGGGSAPPPAAGDASPEMGGDNPGVGIIRVTREEKEAIERLKQLGFDEKLCVQAYFACDKNEELAANLLVDQGWDNDSDHAVFNQAEIGEVEVEEDPINQSMSSMPEKYDKDQEMMSEVIDLGDDVSDEEEEPSYSKQHQQNTSFQPSPKRNITVKQSPYENVPVHDDTTTLQRDPPSRKPKQPINERKPQKKKPKKYIF